MKKKAFLGISAFCFLFPFSVPAVAPTVRALKVPAKITYEFVPEYQTGCDKSGSVHMVGAEKASGCTNPSDFEQYVDVNCVNRTIVFGFGWKKFLVEIVDKYKPKTINFDQIVKHELTHVRLYQKTAEKFYPPTARALLMQYEFSEKQGRSCPEIRNDVHEMFYRYIRKYYDESHKQQKLIDGQENYAYQWAQVHKREDELRRQGFQKEKQTKEDRLKKKKEKNSKGKKRENEIQKKMALDMKAQVLKERSGKRIKLNDDWLDSEKVNMAQSKYNSEKRRREEENRRIEEENRRIEEIENKRYAEAIQKQLHSELLGGKLNMVFSGSIDMSENKKQQNGQRVGQQVERESRNGKKAKSPDLSAGTGTDMPEKFFTDNVFDSKHQISSGEEENERNTPDDGNDQNTEVSNGRDGTGERLTVTPAENITNDSRKESEDYLQAVLSFLKNAAEEFELDKKFDGWMKKIKDFFVSPFVKTSDEKRTK